MRIPATQPCCPYDVCVSRYLHQFASSVALEIVSSTKDPNHLGITHFKDLVPPSQPNVTFLPNFQEKQNTSYNS